MTRSQQPASSVPPGAPRETAVDGPDDAQREALSGELDRILSGRIRDIALSGRLADLYGETSWRQRSRIARAWLFWAMGLSFPMVALDWLYQPQVLRAALLMRGPVFLIVYSALAWIWARPRHASTEGATLLATVAVLMLVGSVLGRAGDEGALHHYLAAAVFAASTALTIIPVRLAWTIASTVAALVAYVAVGLSKPVPRVSITIAFGLFFALVLGAVVLSRRTMNTIQQHAFLLNLRGNLQTRALADANARLAILAATDALTGLPNRRAFEDEAGRLWGDASGPPRSLGIVLFDIDHFKRLNDAAGHGVGDRCLAAIGDRIRAVLPAQGFCARYGGEEFIVLLPDAAPPDLLRAAERLRAAVADMAVADMAFPNPGLPGSPHVTVSLGIAHGVANGRPDDLAGLIAAADGALYRAKAEGRDRVAAAWDPRPGTGTPAAGTRTARLCA